MPVVNPGIRRFLGSAIQRLFNSASFSAPLTHSLVLERGTGSPSFTRASTATVMGYGPTANPGDDAILLTVAANEARFEGARRISEGVWSNTYADGTPLPTTYTYDAVSLNGVAGTYVSTPDSVAADVIGDIDMRAKVSMANWSAGEFGIISKATTAGNQRSYILAVAAGVLRAYVSIGGPAYNFSTASAAHGFAANAVKWIRFIRVAATGDVAYYTSDDGTTWTQLGAAISGTSGAVFSSTAQITVGSYEDTAALFPGKIYQAQIYNGIDGTLAVDFNASRYAGGTTLTGGTGETWALNGSATITTSNDPATGLLSEGAVTQYLGVTATPATQTTESLDTGIYTLWCEGTGSCIASAGTATITGAAAAIDGFPDVFTVTVAGTVTVTVTGSLTLFNLTNTPYKTSYIANTGAAGTSVTKIADVYAAPTASNILAAASTVYLDFTPDHTPSGTIALWGTYVDASNYTAILHDATNMIMRKRIAGVNYDATIANAFSANTTYKVCGSWGASGVTVTVNGTEGTPHANTTAAQIAATMQWGADGNSLQQPFATERNARVWQRQLSASERMVVTS